MFSAILSTKNCPASQKHNFHRFLMILVLFLRQLLVRLLHEICARAVRAAWSARTRAERETSRLAASTT